MNGTRARLKKVRSELETKNPVLCKKLDDEHRIYREGMDSFLCIQDTEGKFITYQTDSFKDATETLKAMVQERKRLDQ